MNERQKRFADEYVIDLNAEAAAIRAGYSSGYARGNAYKLVAKSGIKEYIQKRLEEKESRLIAKQNEVLQYLTSVMRGQSQSEVVVVENIGDFTSEARTMKKAPDEKERLKAAELLKLTGLSIGDIGNAVGYPNQLHFSRAFKNVHGVSPREYRSTHLIDPEKPDKK